MSIPSNPGNVNLRTSWLFQTFLLPHKNSALAGLNDLAGEQKPDTAEANYAGAASDHAS